MTTHRYLGIDYGSRRVGVAVSDPTGLIARPLTTLTVTGDNDAINRLTELVREHEPVGVVVGLPISMSGNRSAATEMVEKFVQKLRAAIAVPVFLEDERLSSYEAEQVLHAHGKRIKGNKEKIDRMAAAIILQSFLDRQSGG